MSMSAELKTNTRISNEKIIKGLRFLIECYNNEIPCNKVEKGLCDMGCGFSANDVRAAFPYAKKIPLVQGLQEGDYMCAASVIANVANPGNYNAWEYTCTFLLSGEESPVSKFLQIVDANNKSQESTKNK